MEKEFMLTRASIINRCNRDGKLHYIFTENERPCKEAYLKEVADANNRNCTRFFIKLEDSITALSAFGAHCDMDVLVSENLDFPGIIALVLDDEDINREAYS